MGRLLALTIAQAGLTTRSHASQAQRARDLKSLLLKAKYDKRWASKHPQQLIGIQEELNRSIHRDAEFPGLEEEELVWQNTLRLQLH